MEKPILVKNVYKWAKHSLSVNSMTPAKKKARTQTAKTSHYDWSSHNNRDISNKYSIAVRNKLSNLQEISETLNYENFVNDHTEAAAECIQTKPKAKHKLPWDTLGVRKKQDNVKTASLCSKRNSANVNAQKLKKAQRELINAYQKEQLEYSQDQINKIRNSVEDIQSRIAWQTVNEVSETKSTSRAKLKAASQEERIQTWKEHFKSLLGKSFKVRDKPITKIIKNQLDIKLGQFTQEELNVEQTKI